MKQLLNEIIYDAKFIKGHTLQPSWFKILKVFLLVVSLVAGLFVFGLRRTLVFWGIFFSLGLVVHMVYRFKTDKFMKNWLDFKITEVDGRLEYQRIGILYYFSIGVNLLFSLLISCSFVK